MEYTVLLNSFTSWIACSVYQKSTVFCFVRQEHCLAPKGNCPRALYSFTWPIHRSAGWNSARGQFKERGWEKRIRPPWISIDRTAERQQNRTRDGKHQRFEKRTGSEHASNDACPIHPSARTACQPQLALERETGEKAARAERPNRGAEGL